MAKESVPVHKNPWVWGAIVVVVIVIFLSIPRGSAEMDSFATCLEDSGAIMHGTDWCPACAQQKELFGASFKKVNYVNCDFESEVCLRARIQSYPTWIINGQSYPGVQPLETLASLTGCRLS